jgi:hypothetical protein
MRNASYLVNNPERMLSTPAPPALWTEQPAALAAAGDSRASWALYKRLRIGIEAYLAAARSPIVKSSQEQYIRTPLLKRMALA